MAVQNSPFRLINFFVEESHITRKPINKTPKLDVKVIPSGLINEENGVFQLNLIVNVSDTNDTFSASINAIGFFSFKGVLKKDDLSTYFYTNAPAIIFPYIRSYIAALTALSGMSAINIPLMNLGKLRKNLQENTRTLQSLKTNIPGQ